MDTILRGFPIPEIYMQDIVEASGSQEHIVVDGQQRITACLEFVRGDFEISESESDQWGGLGFEDLADAEKETVWGYQFVVRLMPPIPDEEMKVVFSRLNRYNMALNKQELRHATYWGEFLGSMENIAKHDFWVDSGLFSANDIRRMLDVEFISELAVGVLHGPQNKKGSLDRWYRVYEEEFPQRDELEATFDAVLGEIRQVLPDLRKTRWSRTSDFYTLFLVLADHRSQLPLSGDKRAIATKNLTKFSDNVTKYLADDKTAKVSADVRAYSNAVSRAATDLANRKTRASRVSNVLKEALAESPKTAVATPDKSASQA